MSSQSKLHFIENLYRILNRQVTNYIPGDYQNQEIVWEIMSLHLKGFWVQVLMILSM